MKVRTIATIDDLASLETTITLSCESTMTALRELIATKSAIQVMERMKFEPIGRDPLSDRPLNVIEQVNQTFTYLATIKALRYLFEHHAGLAPFVINLGTAAGSDIESQDRTLAAEVFAAVSTRSNDKLRKDIRKVGATAAEHKYVFYSCPGEEKAERRTAVSDVKLIALGTCMPTIDGA